MFYVLGSKLMLTVYINLEPSVLSRLKCGGDRGADYTQISPSNPEIHASLHSKQFELLGRISGR